MGTERTEEGVPVQRRIHEPWMGLTSIPLELLG